MAVSGPALAPWRALERAFLGPADARVYGCTRISLSVAGLVNLVHLWPDRYRLFADDGMLSPTLTLALPERGPYFSFFFFVRSHAGIDALLIAAALAMCCLAAGVGVRVAAILSYLWHLSYTYYAMPSLGGWDLVLRACFFVLAWSPAQDPYCLRYLVNRKLEPPREQPRYGLVLIRWQILLIYVATVWLKVGNQYWRNGEVLEYFSISMFSSTASPAALQFPALMALATYATLVMEVAIPFLLWSKRWRWWGVAFGVALHGGIALTSTLAIFSVVMLATYPAFFDTEDVERVERAFAGLRRRVSPARG